MAHSFVQFFDREAEAFTLFQRAFPKHSVLLIDTYDTFDGLEKALRLGKSFRGIRLDSGDFTRMIPRIRERLDEAGRPDALIMISGNLTEDQLLLFELEGLPIDAYGVGTDLVVSGDVPTCDLIYKLVEIEREGRRIPKFKKSAEKATLPSRKKLLRRTDGTKFSRDLLMDWDDDMPGEEYTPLLQHFVHRGETVRELSGIEEARAHLRSQMEKLPKRFRYLHSSEKYPVWLAGRLAERVEEQGL